MAGDIANAGLTLSARTVQAGNLTTAFNRMSRNLDWAFGQGTGAGQINLIVHGSGQVGLNVGPSVDLGDFTDVMNRTHRAFSCIRLAWMRLIDCDPGVAAAYCASSSGWLPWMTMTMAGSQASIFHVDGALMMLSPVLGWTVDVNTRGVFWRTYEVADPLLRGTLEYFFAGVGT